MEKGFSREIVDLNIDMLVADGVHPQVALAKAVGKARTEFKKKYPDTVNFPKHIAIGNIVKTYMTGGEDGG